MSLFVLFFAAFSLDPEVSAALLPISSFFAADSSQTPIIQGTDNLLFIPLEDTDVIITHTLSKTAVYCAENSVLSLVLLSSMCWAAQQRPVNWPVNTLQSDSYNIMVITRQRSLLITALRLLISFLFIRGS